MENKKINIDLGDTTNPLHILYTSTDELHKKLTEYFTELYKDKYFAVTQERWDAKRHKHVKKYMYYGQILKLICLYTSSDAFSTYPSPKIRIKYLNKKNEYKEITVTENLNYHYQTDNSWGWNALIFDDDPESLQLRIELEKDV